MFYRTPLQNLLQVLNRNLLIGVWLLSLAENQAHLLIFMMTKRARASSRMSWMLVSNLTTKTLVGVFRSA